MCSHEWKKVNEIFVCMRCGLTRTPNGNLLFDKGIVNYKPKKRMKHKGGK